MPRVALDSGARRRPQVRAALAGSAFALLSVFGVGAVACRRPTVDQSQTAQKLEDAYRENNVGVALLEQFKPQEAVDAFRRALAFSPLRLARLNLPIALFYAGDLHASTDAARAASASDPAAPQPPYILGLIARAENRPADATGFFKRVLEIDTNDTGAIVNLGQVYLQEQQYEAAAALFRRAAASEPFNATAFYSLGLALTRGGHADEGRRVMGEFQRLRDTGYATTFSSNYLEQGRYAEAIASTGAERDLVDRATPSVRFTSQPLLAAPVGSGLRIALADLDASGSFDLLTASSAGFRLFKPDRGTMRDATTEFGLADACPHGARGAVAGDLDNNGLADLLVLCADGTRLFSQTVRGRFTNISTSSGFASTFVATAAALVDLDHDGDLDVVLLSESGRACVLRNNRNGTFTDITTQTGIAARGGVAGIVPTDVDGRRDIDIVTVDREGLRTWLNRRDGSFAEATAASGLGGVGSVSTIAVADVNKDGFPDFFLGRGDRPGAWALSDGRGRYSVVAAPDATSRAVASTFLDYDNDGLLDLAVVTDRGLVLERNVGDGWTDVSAAALPAEWRTRSSDPARRLISLAVADIDGNGADDLIVADASGRVWAGPSTAASRRAALVVRLTGRASNRSGAGSKLDLRAGSLRQRLETYATTPPVAAADVMFGLGDHRADVVRVLWPSGILQAEILDPRKPPSKTLSLTELDRKPSSCPFLYTWNGERFEFVTDFLGSGEMGYWEAPGIRNVADPEEYVRITSRQLQARNGKLDLRVTNELEETLFLDAVSLLAITHPLGTTVYPNEGMRSKRDAPLLYVVAAPHPPSRATDDRGRDVLDRISQLDRRYADDFDVERVRGYAKPHALTLDLGAAAVHTRGRLLLLLTGWTDYAFSSDKIAGSQAGFELEPPALQAQDSSGSWRTIVGDIGIPVGRPQTIVVDLTGKLPARRTLVRIVTSMRVYWDQVLVDDSGRALALDLGQLQRGAQRDGVSVRRLVPDAAQLRWRGFSSEIFPPPGGPPSYQYDRISLASPWKVMTGHYTREGDVGELLASRDDRVVVSMPGDEVALSFDARLLAPPAADQERTYLLHAQGFSKEMDLNSASPDTVAPVPFVGMPSYPYPPAAGDGVNERRRATIERYNTRIIAKSLPPLELVRSR